MIQNCAALRNPVQSRFDDDEPCLIYEAKNQGVGAPYFWRLQLGRKDALRTFRHRRHAHLRRHVI